MWSLENYTPETHLLVIEDLKKQNKELKDELESQKALLDSSQTLCLLLKEELDFCKTTIADWYRRREEHRRASP